MVDRASSCHYVDDYDPSVFRQKIVRRETVWTFQDTHLILMYRSQLFAR